MERTYEKLQKALKAVREITDFVPKVALVLGSGLGNYAQNIAIKAEIPYNKIPEFPVSTVAGHDGRFIFGYVKDTPVVCMKGRVHFYEGYSMEDVVMPIRLMHLMGAQILFLTNAAGGVNLSYKPGDLMLITDHIGCFVPNPLVGQNIEQLGVRFTDQSNIYNENLRKILRKSAEKNDILLKEGVYCQLSGPTYETPAEVRMLRTLGTDAVGMSTVVEAMAANHCGMMICGISCITNMAAGILQQPLDHKEVQQIADQNAVLFANLVTDAISQM